ncbi:MAG: isoprenylcysteine carboxylmethyltransferase family protein [Marinilabiliales bacterium]|nr:isoprenylcysteine carboxylmethyltransferase family protein [Marinilabiliales bacterium]
MLFTRLMLKIPVPWVYVLTYLLGLLLGYFLPIESSLPFPLMYLKISGVVIFLLGMILAGRSLLIFHRARTTTTPGEQSKVFVTTGPYRFSRNPMYVSLFLAYLGEAGFLSQLWPVLVLPLLWLYLQRVVIPLEESVLLRDFGTVYVTYCQRVRRWM